MRIGPRLARSTPFFYGWVVLFSAGSSQFVRNAVASLTLAVFIYPMTQELGWSRTLIAGAASLGGLGAAAANPLVGRLVDRFGARLVLTAGIFGAGLCTISLALTASPLIFYLGFGLGRVIFLGPLPIGASVVVSRWFVKKRGRTIGLLFASHAAGMTLFPLVASFIIQERGWQAAWLVLGLMVWVLALAPVSLLIIERPEDVGLRPDGVRMGPSEPSDSRAQHPAEPAWTLPQAMRTQALWMLASVAGSLFLIQVGVNVHLGAYFRDQGLSAAATASAISVTAISAAVGSIFWGWTAERVPVRFVFASVALLMASGAGLLTGATTLAEAITFACVFGLSLGGILVVPSVAYASYFGRPSLGSIRGVTETFVALGQATGAVLSGLIYDTTGTYHAVFLAYAALAAACFAVLLAARPPQHTDTPSETCIDRGPT